MPIFTISLEQLETRMQDTSRLFNPSQVDEIIRGPQLSHEDKAADFKRRTIRCLGLLMLRKRMQNGEMYIQ